MTRTQVFLFTGRKCVGKSTSAKFVLDFLASNNNFNFDLIGFADPLRKMMIHCFGISPEQVYGSNEQKASKTNWFFHEIDSYLREADPSFNHKDTKSRITVRELMQLVGTNLFRNYFNENIWEKILWESVEVDPDKIYVIHDGRRETEITLAPPSVELTAIKLERELPRDPNEHSSEANVDIINPELFNYTIKNNGSKEELRDQVEDIIRSRVPML